VIHSAVAISFQIITQPFDQRMTFLFLICHVVVMLLLLFITLYVSHIRYDFEQCVYIEIAVPDGSSLFIGNH